MDIATLGGLGGGFILIVGAIILAGNPLYLFVHLPSFVIVVVGSFSAMVAASPLNRALGIIQVLKIATNLRPIDKQGLITQLVGYSESARREGLLSLDDAVNDIEYEFMRTGLRLVVDGTDPEIIKRIMNTNLAQIEDRHQKGIGFFDSWSKIAPAFGMIGTLLGLVGMMANLEDTSSVGPNMAVALITTLYGSIFANLILTPIKIKLEDRHGEESSYNSMVIEGILSIQAGDNPRILEQKLYTFLPPSERALNDTGE